MSGPLAPLPQQLPPVAVVQSKDVDLRFIEPPAPVTTARGALVSIVLILVLGALALAAFHYGTPALGVPPNAPQNYTAEAGPLYEKAYAIYQAAARDRGTFVKDVLLVIVPALTALGGYMLGRQSKSG
jgi:hypothetical protein